MCRSLLLNKTCIGNSKKQLRNAIGFHWVSVRRENWNHLPQIWTFYLDEHLFGQEENICATKDGMDKKRSMTKSFSDAKAQKNLLLINKR